MIEEIARHRCEGDDFTPLLVLERRHRSRGEAGPRGRIGAAWLELADGTPVRYVDPSSFEVVATGEVLRHDQARCGCVNHGSPSRRAPTGAAAA